MKNSDPTLLLEINNYGFTFFVCKVDDQNNYSVLLKLESPAKDARNNETFNFENLQFAIKENIYLIEQKLNHTFKEIVLILENFNPIFFNLSGFKKLNGSQVIRENITYIINTQKSYLNNIEKKNKVIHIFNSKFYLDNKETHNLPIGLFGDFYSHELSFSLIRENDYLNLENILNKSNLKIKKIILKSFIQGAFLSNKHLNLDTFFSIYLGNTNSKIFFFENNALKFEQNFKFGTDIILKDISKITSLKKDTLNNILNNITLNEEILENELIEKEFFNENYRKIKKKLIYEISLARIREILDLILLNNINLKYYNTRSKSIFLSLNNNSQSLIFKKIFEDVLLKNINKCADVKFLHHPSDDKLIETANEIVHFGWKKEAIPITQSQKSILARIFHSIFG